MRFTEILQMCFRNLIRRKSRTFLTVIGVVIGTCAIIVMVSLGIGIKEVMNNQLEAYGDLKVIEVYNWEGDSNSSMVIDDDVLAGWSGLEGVDCVTPMCGSDEYLQLVAGKDDRYNAYADIVGVYPEALQTLEYELLDGAYLTNEKMGKTLPVLVGEDLAYQFTDTKRPDGSNMVYPEEDENGNMPEPLVDFDRTETYLKNETWGETGNEDSYYQQIRVIGTLKKDYSKNYRTSGGLFMSIDNMKQLTKDIKKFNKEKTTNSTMNYNEVYVHVSDISYVESVVEVIEGAGFSTWSMDSERKSMEQGMLAVQAILGGLGAISLFVAAIGITNTMVMSIYERTKEIGVMKALGCYVRDIRLLFLMEAAAIGLLGGVIGIILSYFFSFMLNVVLAEGVGSMMGGNVGGNISIIPLWLVALGMIFSTMVGIIAGFMPAKKATKISALEAIRSAE